MNNWIIPFLTRLGINSLFLIVTGVVVIVALTVLRIRSPRLHRVAWCIVLLQGLLLFQMPLEISWYESNPTERSALPTRLVESRTTIASRESTGRQPESTEGEPKGNSAARMHDTPETAKYDDHGIQVTNSNAILHEWHWPGLLLFAWASGVAIILTRWAVGYCQFVQKVASDQ
ncbi:hypothetical protein ACFL2H_08685 [Planctomycetota bacterium]